MTENLDHIIADKLNNISFDFKTEYWSKMQGELDANCIQTNATCSSTSVGGFLSGSLIATFAIIASVIIFFPWAINQDILTAEDTICTDNNTSITTVLDDISTNSEVTTNVVSTKKENKQIAQTTSTEILTKKKGGNLNNDSKKKIIRRKVKINSDQKKTQSSKPAIAPKQSVEQKEISEKPESDTTLVKQTIEIETDSFEKEVVDTTNPIKPEPILFETDSVIIPDAKLLGNDRDKVKTKRKVKVEKGLEPVKNVKTKSKPIKRVFKKRKGILYRMGIRK